MFIMINISILVFDHRIFFAQTPVMFILLQHKLQQFLNLRETRSLWLIAAEGY